MEFFFGKVGIGQAVGDGLRVGGDGDGVREKFDFYRRRFLLGKIGI